jgi:hypothetical protein
MITFLRIIVLLETFAFASASRWPLNAALAMRRYANPICECVVAVSNSAKVSWRAAAFAELEGMVETLLAA